MISLKNLHRSYETDQSIIVCPFVTTMGGKKKAGTLPEKALPGKHPFYLFLLTYFSFACKASMSAKSTGKSKAQLGLSSGKKSKSPNYAMSPRKGQCPSFPYGQHIQIWNETNTDHYADSQDFSCGLNTPKLMQVLTLVPVRHDSNTQTHSFFSSTALPYSLVSSTQSQHLSHCPILSHHTFIHPTVLLPPSRPTAKRRCSCDNMQGSKRRG